MEASASRDEFLLTQAIADIQGSIHANDNKSSAGLVAQGLLAAAVVTVVTNLGGVYGDGTEGAKLAIKFLLGLSLLAALGSILFFVRAVFPYSPQTITGRLRERAGTPYKEIFFPDVEKLHEAAASTETFDAFATGLEDDVRALRDDPDAAMREYVAELLKVADIRANEAKQAEIGFWFLGVEVILVTAYLAVAGCIAGQVSGFAAPKDKPPTLRWSLAGDGVRRSVSSGTRLAVRNGGEIEVRLIAATDRAQLTQVRLVRRTTLRCVRHGRVRNVLAGPPAVQKASSPGKGLTLAVEVRMRHRRCPPPMRYAGFSERFSAAVEDADQRHTAGWLLLHGPSGPGWH